MHETPLTAERPAFEAEKVPPLDVQQEFLRVAFEQSDAIEKRTRMVKGPYLDDFGGIMAHVGEKLTALDDSLTPEYAMPAGYRSPEVNMRMGRLRPRVVDAISALQDERRQMIDALVSGRILPAANAQTIPGGVLSEPPYHTQDVDGRSIAQDCVGTCFRMAFEGVTGWAPPQRLLNSQLRWRYGSAKVDDEVLMGVFQTEAFKAMCDKQVATYELMGTDLDQIGRLTTNAKKKWPESDVYCMVYQSSKTVKDSNIWHSNMLLGAENGVVVTHDPREAYGPNSEQSYEEFIDRWAVSYNRAHLIIAK